MQIKYKWVEVNRFFYEDKFAPIEEVCFNTSTTIVKFKDGLMIKTNAPVAVCYTMESE